MEDRSLFCTKCGTKWEDEYAGEPAPADQQPADAGDPAQQEDYPGRPTELQVRPRDYPARSDDYQGRPGDYQGRPGDYQGRPGDYQGRPGDYQGRPGDYQGRPGDYQGRPGDYQGRPGDYQGRPGDYQGRPGENQRDSAGQYTPPYGQGDSFDHTSEFDPNDIKEHKVYCMLIYLMGTVGIIIELLGGADSEYTKFHVREGLKIAVANMLAALATIFLFWTLIIPLITSIFMTILMVVKVICFVRICKGKAIETPIIRGFKFLN